MIKSGRQTSVKRSWPVQLKYTWEKSAKYNSLQWKHRIVRYKINIVCLDETSSPSNSDVIQSDSGNSEIDIDDYIS